MTHPPSQSVLDQVSPSLHLLLAFVPLFGAISLVPVLSSAFLLQKKWFGRFVQSVHSKPILGPGGKVDGILGGGA